MAWEPGDLIGHPSSATDTLWYLSKLDQLYLRILLVNEIKLFLVSPISQVCHKNKLRKLRWKYWRFFGGRGVVGEKHSLNKKFSKRKPFDRQFRNHIFQLSSVHICWAQTVYAAFWAVHFVASTGIVISWNPTNSYVLWPPMSVQVPNPESEPFSFSLYLCSKAANILDTEIKWCRSWAPPPHTLEPKLWLGV